ncbi:MAG TPA: ABC transporter permease, partial [Gemmatimonadaceae bacterium]
SSAVDELIAKGMTRAEAEAAAREQFGDVGSITSTLYTLSEQRERTMARTEWLDAIKQDLAFGFRQLRKSPAFTAIAVLTLALGIGANSAIFSVVYSVVLNPLPFANGDRIVELRQNPNPNAPMGNFLRWERDANAFEAMGATLGARQHALTGFGDPIPIWDVNVSAGYWKVLKAPPVLGRYFNADEDRYNAPHVGVLSYALWQSTFKGDRGVIGRAIMFNGNATTIIGVAPMDYIDAPPAERIWTPLAPAPSGFTDFQDHELTVYGLVKPGIAISNAVAQVRQIDTPLAQEHPHSGYDGTIIAKPLIDSYLGDARSLLYTLLGAVSLVLLIACVNIANLLLARAAVRKPEVAIRSALGATRSRIVAQLLAESLLLALAGGIVGVGIGMIAIRFLVTSPVGIPRLQQTSMNGPVLIFTLVLTLLCALVFGLVPALRASRLDLQQTLRDGGRDAKGTARDTLRGALVIAELSLAQVLLFGAALLIRSAMLLQAVPLGFDTHNLMAFSVNLPGARYQGDGKVEATFHQIDAALAAIPGVKSVARTEVAPVYSRGTNWNAMREGSNGHDEGAHVADMRSATPGYFATLGVRLLRGREFKSTDGGESPRVAIISRTLAKGLFGNSDPIGQRISNGSVDNPSWREIVGVAEDVRGNGPAENGRPTLYMPSTQWVNGGQTFIVRGNVPVAALVPQFRRAIASVDPLLPLLRPMTFDDALQRHLALSRFTMLLLVMLGGTGLVLAIVGVYGVVSYFVTQRTHELGVRVALGAPSGALQWLVVRQGIAFALVGVAIGGTIGLVASRLLRSMVFGITAHDPITFAIVGLTLAMVAVCASYIPARRATRIDPLEALRSS